MTEQSGTGSAQASGDSGQPDYQAKYNGLNAAFQRRVNEFTAREEAWETEKADLTAKAAKVAEYEAKEAAAREEAEALATYDQLTERFEKAPPPPTNPNASNYAAQTGWDERYPRKDAPEPSSDPGWPA